MQKITKIIFLMKVKIYTDGACSGNPGKGGWAAIIIDSNLKQSSISGSENNTQIIEWN